MDKLLIKGRSPLNGEIYASGAKNSALPILAASLLSDSPVRVGNLPHLNDVTTMLELLGSMGVDVMLSDDMEVEVDTSSIKNLDARSSVQVKSHLKQLTNKQEAIHLETIGLLEDRLFKKLSGGRVKSQ